MLDAIKKKFFSATEKEVSMKKEDNLQPNAAVETNTAQLAELQAALASQSEALEAVTGKLAEMQSKFEGAQAALDAVEATKAALVADAKAVRLQARKDAIVASVGTDKADALLAATDLLDDVSFKAVVNAMAVSFEKEAATPLFKEVGLSAEASAPDVVEESAEAKLLKAKYQTK
jgi:peptidoglycan hydrolase CwlO-like protein